MNSRQYLKLGIIITVVTIGGILTYRLVKNEIRKAKLRKAIKEQQQNAPPDANIVNPVEVQQTVSKVAYPKGKYVNVRSSPVVDNSSLGGIFSLGKNFVGAIFSPDQVGKVLEAAIQGDGKVWYRVSIDATKLKKSPDDLGSPTKSTKEGWVREDVVTIK
jgi:hypothetical protein